MIDASHPQRTVVLVVEDDPMVRAMAVDALEDDGFEVIEAATGDHALAILQRRTNIDVLLTDVEMPGSADGFQLARSAREMDPQMVIIVVSGGVRSGFSGMAPDARFVPKPYAMSRIVGMIHEMAGRSPQ
ncbi:response regulator [Microvirga arabica]|uniref:Response regulator n=1 Tax=Microvirga arabica TaxID=1128671 RepID=A0ABV6YE06_9HYPH